MCRLGPERRELPNWLPAKWLIPRSRCLDCRGTAGEVCAAGRTCSCAWPRPGPWPRLSHLTFCGSWQVSLGPTFGVQAVGEGAAWQTAEGDQAELSRQLARTSVHLGQFRKGCAPP